MVASIYKKGLDVGGFMKVQELDVIRLKNGQKLTVRCLPDVGAFFAILCLVAAGIFLFPA